MKDMASDPQGFEAFLRGRRLVDSLPLARTSSPKGVKCITLLSPGAIILGAMLFLSAFARLVPAEPEANDLLAQSRAALGHLGLTIIAIVFALITFWKG
jgi:hypothetical protein